MAAQTKPYAVARADEIAPGQVMYVAVAGLEIALFNIDGTYYATDDACTHMGARLSDGYVDGDIVECSLHFGKFNIRTGKACSAPCTVDLRTYPVEVEGAEVIIRLPAGE